MLRTAALAVIATLCGVLATPAEGARSPQGSAPGLSAVLAAEAARARTPEQLEVLRTGTRSTVPSVRRTAIRALGRLERPALVEELLSLMALPEAGARAEAANAAAQAAGADAIAAARALTAFVARLTSEDDADVRAAICEALGRLPIADPADLAKVERLLIDETARVAFRKGVTVQPASPLLGVKIGWGHSKRISTTAAVGALRGLESLLRLRGKASPPSDETLAQLRQVAAAAVTPARRLALLALNAVAGADAGTIDRAIGDDDVEVRRLAVAAGRASAGHLRRALADRAPAVRYEALRAWGRRYQAQEGCQPVIESVRDKDPHVGLLALDLLGNPCRAGEPVVDVLTAAAGGLDGRVPSGWHRPAHAVAALARVAPGAAVPLLPRLVSAGAWGARMYAARAAASAGDRESLRLLAGDEDANVREAAIAGMARLEGHAADHLYLRALESDDPQLLMTAARALDGTTGRDAAAGALLSALARLTKADSDSSRDARLALLDRLGALGSEASAPALVPLLRDPDPRVAERAAAVLTAWTGRAHAASPTLRPPQPVPSEEEIARLSRSVVRVTMKSGGRFEIGLLTGLAPLSCTAFARLAASGYYDGLAFHRVVPNFVVQGGSPGANEFSGAGRFVLDEGGREMQARGTVGSSTRGRDTGDGQFYVNLVDLPRLDHEYTVFGRVTAGMEVVDRILEGDVMARVEVILKPS
jgi:cyclophilin family peptidyl-prolyl cis-trans isomerase/HEAT repeat protein